MWLIYVAYSATGNAACIREKMKHHIWNVLINVVVKWSNMVLGSFKMWVRMWCGSLILQYCSLVGRWVQVSFFKTAGGCWSIKSWPAHHLYACPIYNFHFLYPDKDTPWVWVPCLCWCVYCVKYTWTWPCLDLVYHAFHSFSGFFNQDV